ncbi:unnamed protein product [Chrysoparadoxa australica]
MPCVSAVVGYVTNVVALKMTFYPLEFFGPRIYQPEGSPLGLLGWQGIVPAKAGKMASKLMDLLLGKVVDVKKLFKQIDPLELYHTLEPGLLAMLDGAINQSAQKHFPSQWEALGKEAQLEVVFNATFMSQRLIANLMEELQAEIEQVVDLKQLVVQLMIENKALLNKIFLKVGAQELLFIELSGLFFGFGFGLIQLAIFIFYQGAWLLPVASMIVGYATNAIALKLIFRPVDEHIICGLRIQGLFLKRQQEVAAQFAEVYAAEVLTSEAIWNHILMGENSPRFFSLFKSHVHRFIDESVEGMTAGGLRPLLGMYVTEQQFFDLGEEMAQPLMEQLHGSIRLSYAYCDKALALQALLTKELQAFSSKEFEGLLHPVFEEDEAKLISVGAMLGLLTGVFQYFVMVGGS